MDSYIYLKSLSGDIIPISLSPYHIEDNRWDAWNRIISIIASENDCLESQVAIFDVDQKDYDIPPKLVPDKQYSFLIRDMNFSINLRYCENIPDRRSDHITYNKFSISIIDSDERKMFDIYEQTGGLCQSIYYHEKDMLVIRDENKEITSVSVKNQDEGALSMYGVLCENLYFPWYEKQTIIDRIMIQYDNIEKYRREYEEYTDYE